VWACVGGEDVLIYASYLQSGRCAHNEPVEKRPMKGDHMRHGNVLARELMGVTIYKKEV